MNEIETLQKQIATMSAALEALKAKNPAPDDGVKIDYNFEFVYDGKDTDHAFDMAMTFTGTLRVPLAELSHEIHAGQHGACAEAVVEITERDISTLLRAPVERAIFEAGFVPSMDFFEQNEMRLNDSSIWCDTYADTLGRMIKQSRD